MIGEPTEVVSLWPDPEIGPWRLVVHTAPVKGRMVCVGVEMLSYTPKGDPRVGDIPGDEDIDRVVPVTTSTLRSLRLGEIVSEILTREIGSGPKRIDLEEQLGSVGVAYIEERLKAAKASTAGRGGRRGHGPDHYAQVAMVYTEAYARGGYPTRAVADKWFVSKSTAAKWVARARKFGFLGQTEQGKAGGARYDETGLGFTITSTLTGTDDLRHPPDQGGEE